MCIYVRKGGGAKAAGKSVFFCVYSSSLKRLLLLLLWGIGILMKKEGVGGLGVWGGGGVEAGKRERE